MVYSKPPFSGPRKLLDYLGRYTHPVAISNHRIIDIADGFVLLDFGDDGRVLLLLLDDVFYLVNIRRGAHKG